MTEPSFLQRFAKMLGVPERQGEDALRSEAGAKFVVSRRTFLGAGAAIAAAAPVFSFANPVDAAIAEAIPGSIPIKGKLAPPVTPRLHMATGIYVPMMYMASGGVSYPNWDDKLPEWKSSK